MTNHLENFRRRYAFHLRNWQLDNNGINSHQKSLQERSAMLIRVILQPAGTSEKVIVLLLVFPIPALSVNCHTRLVMTKMVQYCN